MYDPIIKRLMENRIVGLREDTESPEAQYLSYLDKHRAGVKEVFETIIRPILEEEGNPEDFLEECAYLIENHDASKYEDAEFPAYRDNFCDPENNPKSGNAAYDMAWNHHQKSNPHHWQYWVLINDVDEPQLQPIDMPFKYIVELLCDWQSAGKHYGNSAYDWYVKQKDKMILSDNTRKTIEKYIEYLK